MTPIKLVPTFSLPLSVQFYTLPEFCRLLVSMHVQSTAIIDSYYIYTTFDQTNCKSIINDLSLIVVLNVSNSTT